MWESDVLKAERWAWSEAKAARSARRRAGWEAMVPCSTIRRPAWSVGFVELALQLLFLCFVSWRDFRFELRYLG